MRRLLLGLSCVLSAVSLLGVGACSSDDSGGGGSGDTSYEPPGNGVGLGESEACKAITGAEDAKRAELSCGPVTRPPCPTYLQKGNPACSEYDQGTVSACVSYIAGHTSCAALTQKKCVVKVLAGSAPNGCPSNDAGPDAADDAEADATPDAGSDAEMDATSDAEADATADATPEAEAGTDAATD